MFKNCFYFCLSINFIVFGTTGDQELTIQDYKKQIKEILLKAERIKDFSDLKEDNKCEIYRFTAIFVIAKFKDFRNENQKIQNLLQAYNNNNEEDLSQWSLLASRASKNLLTIDQLRYDIHYLKTVE